MKNLTIIISSVLLFGLASCQKESELSELVEFEESQSIEQNDVVSVEALDNVLPAMRPYVLRFEEEANERGLSFLNSLAQLETNFENISQDNVAGTCSWNSHAPELVTIDIPFWNNASHSAREWVIFHELGHCILDRPHTERENENGVCLSLMASGTGSCFTLFNTENRAYYLDELFSVGQ